MTPRGTDDLKVKRLRGRLHVLRGMRVELRAIGAPCRRLEENRRAIEDVQRHLAQLTGILTDSP